MVGGCAMMHDDYDWFVVFLLIGVAAIGFIIIRAITQIIGDAFAYDDAVEVDMAADWMARQQLTSPAHLTDVDPVKL
jgi:hypothetical protein